MALNSPWYKHKFMPNGKHETVPNFPDQYARSLNIPEPKFQRFDIILSLPIGNSNYKFQLWHEDFDKAECKNKFVSGDLVITAKPGDERPLAQRSYQLLQKVCDNGWKQVSVISYLNPKREIPVPLLEPPPPADPNAPPPDPAAPPAPTAVKLPPPPTAAKPPPPAPAPVDAGNGAAEPKADPAVPQGPEYVAEVAVPLEDARVIKSRTDWFGWWNIVCPENTFVDPEGMPNFLDDEDLFRRRFRPYWKPTDFLIRIPRGTAGFSLHRYHPQDRYDHGDMAVLIREWPVASGGYHAILIQLAEYRYITKEDQEKMGKTWMKIDHTYLQAPPPPPPPPPPPESDAPLPPPAP